MLTLPRRMAPLVLALAVASPCLAFPDKPVTVVVPFAAGGSGDVVARMLGEKLSAAWGKPVIVDNRPGAGGAIGTVHVMRQPADGHTLLLHSPAPMIATELLRPQAGYHVQSDFSAVSDVFKTPVVLVASTRTKARDAKAFFDEARKDTGLSYASHGPGSGTHYLGEQIKAAVNAPLIHVPVGGEGQMITQLAGGHVSSAYMSLSGARKAVATGGAWIVAITGSQRWPGLDAPTFAELGIAGAERTSGMTLLVRKSTPPEVLRQLSRDVADALNKVKASGAAQSLGVDLGASNPERAQAGLNAEMADWKKHIQQLGNLTSDN